MTLTELETKQNYKTQDKINAIIKAVEVVHDKQWDELNRKNRRREFVHARQAIIYYVTMLCPELSLDTVGGLFSGMGDKYSRKTPGFDHSTIVHARRNYSDLLKFDKPTIALDNLVSSILADFINVRTEIETTEKVLCIKLSAETNSRLHKIMKETHMSIPQFISKLINDYK